MRTKFKENKSANFSMNSLLKFGIFCLIFLSLASCREDDSDDILRPEIKVITTNPETSNGIVCEVESDIILLINSGEAVEVTVEVTDDVALGSLKFDLHHNFDCHGHKSASKSTVWNHIEIIELTGTSQVVTRAFQSPEDVRPGNYHLGMMALDEMGREAEMRFFDLVVRDPSDTLPPEVVIESPQENAVHQRGQILAISGTITDDSSLDSGGYELTMMTPQGIELSLSRIDYPEGSGNSASFDESYAIPGFVNSGTCVLRMKVNDWKNNEIIVQRPFELVD